MGVDMLPSHLLGLVFEQAPSGVGPGAPASVIMRPSCWAQGSCPSSNPPQELSAGEASADGLIDPGSTGAPWGTRWSYLWSRCGAGQWFRLRVKKPEIH